MHNCGFPDSAADAALLIFHHVLLTPQVSMIVNSHKRAAAGFTLIEMMIAVAFWRLSPCPIIRDMCCAEN
jgi:hypothetical protein